MNRCSWCGNDSLYIKYHDEEWGVPVKNDKDMFEFLILEGMQAGLSWITVLKKRDNFRKAFDNFDPEKMAGYDEKKINELLNNPGIIRNKLKISGAINNARKYLELKEQQTLSNYFWEFTKHKVIQNNWKDIKEVPAKTDLSDRISKDLKKRGFKFIGSTIVYAHLQAAGIVNDHTIDCFRHKELS